MTEERMLQTTTRTRTWFSGICSCGEEFYCRNNRITNCSLSCSPKATGTSHGKWKGGRWEKKGYVLLAGHRGHPRVNKRTGLLQEHILVMEKHLGRYLKDGENVHHRNGIRNDNRIDNLELWTSYQPSGQRVDDLLDFVATNYPEEMKAKLVVRNPL